MQILLGLRLIFGAFGQEAGNAKLIPTLIDRRPEILLVTVTVEVVLREALLDVGVLANGVALLDRHLDGGIDVLAQDVIGVGECLGQTIARFGVLLERMAVAAHEAAIVVGELLGGNEEELRALGILHLRVKGGVDADNRVDLVIFQSLEQKRAVIDRPVDVLGALAARRAGIQRVGLDIGRAAHAGAADLLALQVGGAFDAVAFERDARPAAGVHRVDQLGVCALQPRQEEARRPQEEVDFVIGEKLGGVSRDGDDVRLDAVVLKALVLDGNVNTELAAVAAPIPDSHGDDVAGSSAIFLGVGIALSARIARTAASHRGAGSRQSAGCNRALHERAP